MRAVFMTSVGLVVFLAQGAHAWAQDSADCGCDHVVLPETGSINGEELGYEPGDVVCIEAGARDFLRLYDVKGTADEPIVVKNCGGQVVIDNADRGYGLTLDGSEHVQITGTGDAKVMYGFKVRASKDGPDYSASCIVASGLSTNYEMDHIEAYECGFAGISAKTDPTCDVQDRSDFVQRDTELHHLYLHDTGGEGIYFGNTGYPSREGTCDGQMVDLIPHTHEGVYITDNIIEDTGWDGAQIGVSPKDCFFTRNRIARVGLRGVEFQTQGLQIGGGSACVVRDNYIEGGPAVGIIVLDAADTLIANNVIVGFLDGIYLNDRGDAAAVGASYQVIHNTVVNTVDRGITAYGTSSKGSVIWNNLIASGGDAPLGLGNNFDRDEACNVIADSVGEVGFVGAASDDYQLTEGALGVDACASAADYGVTTDQLGAERDDAPDAGAFEYGAVPPDAPTAPPGPGQSPSQPGAEGGGGSGSGSDGGGGSEGGCSCRASGASGRTSFSGLAFGLTLLALLGWRRRAAH